MAIQNVFTGKNATLTLRAPPNANAPEQNDANITAQFFFGNATPAVGRATGIQVSVQTDLAEFHEIGARLPVVLHPGDIHISGTIDRAYVSGALIVLLLGRATAANQAEPFAQPSFGLTIDLADPAVPGNKAELVLDGVKFQNWGMTIPEDDFVMENVTFKALTLHINTQQPSSGGAAANAGGGGGGSPASTFA
jgi:hypothetical protein